MSNTNHTSQATTDRQEKSAGGSADAHTDGRLFAEAELGEVVTPERRHRKKARAQQREEGQGLQQLIGDRSVVITGEDGIEWTLVVNRSDFVARRTEGGVLCDAKGEHLRWMNSRVLQSVSYEEDGVRYLWAPVWVGPDDQRYRVDVGALLEMAKIVDPDTTYRPASEEQETMAKFRSAVSAYSSIESLYSAIARGYKHPEKSKRVADIRAIRDQVRAHMVECGVDEAGIELAVKLFRAGYVEVRDLWEGVNAIEGSGEETSYGGDNSGRDNSDWDNSGLGRAS